MKITSIKPNQSYGRYDSKELINSRELIGFKDDRFWNLATVRWYMGKSSTASTIYCQVWINSNVMPIEHNFSSPSGAGKAGGGGYCKMSASFADALDKAGIQVDTGISGRGMSLVDDFLTCLALSADFTNHYISRG